jgi:hypothetical protein
VMTKLPPDKSRLISKLEEAKLEYLQSKAVAFDIRW